MKQEGKYKNHPTFFNTYGSQHSPLKSQTIGVDYHESLNFNSNNKNSTKSFLNLHNLKNVSSKKSNKVTLPNNLKLSSAHQTTVIENSFYEEIYHKYLIENTKKQKKKAVGKKKFEQSSSKALLPIIGGANSKPNFQCAYKSIETTDNNLASNTNIPSKDLNDSKEEIGGPISSGLVMHDDINFVNGPNATDKKKMRLDIFSKMIKAPIIEEVNNIDNDTIDHNGENERNIYQSKDAALSQNKLQVRYLNNLFKDKKQLKSISILPSIFNKKQTYKEVSHTYIKLHLDDPKLKRYLSKVTKYENKGIILQKYDWSE